MKVHALRGDSSPFVKAIAGAGDRVGADVVVERPAVMTVRGTVDKTAVLLGLVVASAVGAWRLLATSPAPLLRLVLVGLVGGLVVALVTTAKPHLAPATAPIYAIFEGLVLGSLSWVTATELSQGVVTLAVGATFATLAAMLFAFGLVVTLVWIYLEILRLLAEISGDDS